MKLSMHLKVLLLFFALGGVVAKADTMTQNFPVTYGSVSQTEENSHGFRQFNPALGTLNSAVAYFMGDITFVPSAADGKYTVSFGGYAGGSSSPAFFFSDTQSGQFQSNAPVDLSSVIGPGNYFLAFIDLSVTDGTVVAPSSLMGTLTYSYTPAVTPEPSSILLVGTALLGMAGGVRGTHFRAERRAFSLRTVRRTFRGVL